LHPILKNKVIMRSLDLSRHINHSPLWSETPLIDADFKSKPTYTMDEWFNKLCKSVGEKFGMSDIREA